jgi:hypothetical protein
MAIARRAANRRGFAIEVLPGTGRGLAGARARALSPDRKTSRREALREAARDAAARRSVGAEARQARSPFRVLHTHLPDPLLLSKPPNESKADRLLRRLENPQRVAQEIVPV